MREILSLLADLPFEFGTRPTPVPADFRPAWRIALVLVILDRFHGKKARFAHLHLIGWAVRTPSSRTTFSRAFSTGSEGSSALVRYEPSLSRALALAESVRLIERTTSGVYAMTAHGLRLVNILNRDPSLLAIEKTFLASLGTRLTQGKLNQLLERQA